MSRSALLLAWLVAVGALALAACGDDDSPGDDSGPRVDSGSDATVPDGGRDAAMNDARPALDGAIDAAPRDTGIDDARTTVDSAIDASADSGAGDCTSPIDLAAAGIAIPNGYALRVLFTGRRDEITPSCQDSGLVDVVLRFVPTRDGPIHVRTHGAAALAAYATCGGAELDCQYDGAYATVGLLDFDGRAGVPMDIVVSARTDFAEVDVELREMPVGAEGDACDPRAIESLCGAGLACDGTCAAATDLGCGAGGAVIDVSSLWEERAELGYAGSFRGTDDLGRVTCGRDAANDAVHVVHLAHGTRIRSAGVINIGAAMSIRTACTSDEVGCSLGMRVPMDQVFPAGTDLFFVAEQTASHVGDEYILEIVHDVILAEGEPCTEAMGASAAAVCADGLVCDESSSRCRITVCGDGTPEGLEACDDGAMAELDGCSPTCTLEDQGNGGDGCPGTVLRMVPAPGGSYVAYATGTTAGHDDDTHGSMCPGVFMSADVRYELSVPAGGTLSITFDIAREWDPAVRIHAGACGGDRVGASVLACESSATRPMPWSISTDVGAGTYTITIDEALGRETGPFSMHVTLTP